jgi:hypothetical protein
MALDFAIWQNIAHGGWCPKGRTAEDGPLAARYLLTQTPSSSYLQRTELNVRDSDGTVIFTIAPALTGGSRRTAIFAVKHKKPWLHIYRGGDFSPEMTLLDFIREHRIKILNVAGPRASKEPEIAAFVKRVFESALFPRPTAWGWRAWRRVRTRASNPMNEKRPLRRQRDDHHFGSLLVLAVTAGAFLLVTWVATKAFFFFLQERF